MLLLYQGEEHRRETGGRDVWTLVWREGGGRRGGGKRGEGGKLVLGSNTQTIKLVFYVHVGVVNKII